jgi:uncharacterized protein
MTARRLQKRAAVQATAVLTSLILVALLSGCATYTDRNAKLRDYLGSGQYESALQVVDNAAGDKDKLLNLLEYALVLHYADRWEESNAVFERAEQLSDDLYTKSVSEAVFSLLSNDNSIAYRATPYEMALVPYYRALNYVYLGSREDALVEARKAELAMRENAEIARQLSENEAATDLNAQLADNAFLHYVRGMLLEWGGETNGAFQAYREAARAYDTATGTLDQQTPPWLGEDLLRTGRRLGFRDQLAEIATAYPELLPETLGAEDQGEVVLFLELGYAPSLVSEAIDIPIMKQDNYDSYDLWAVELSNRHLHGYGGGSNKIAYWLRIAMPSMIDTPPAVRGARISTGTLGGNTRTVVVEDIAGRAQLDFQAAQGKILLKTIARGLTKFFAKKKVEEQSAVAGFLANLFGAATEQADTRSWLTIPHDIAVARLTLPPGTYDLEVQLVDEHGRDMGTEIIAGVRVRARDWTFMSRRVF